MLCGLLMLLLAVVAEVVPVSLGVQRARGRGCAAPHTGAWNLGKSCIAYESAPGAGHSSRLDLAVTKRESKSSFPLGELTEKAGKCVAAPSQSFQSAEENGVAFGDQLESFLSVAFCLSERPVLGREATMNVFRSSNPLGPSGSTRKGAFEISQSRARESPRSAQGGNVQRPPCPSRPQ